MGRQRFHSHGVYGNELFPLEAQFDYTLGFLANHCFNGLTPEPPTRSTFL